MYFRRNQNRSRRRSAKLNVCSSTDLAIDNSTVGEIIALVAKDHLNLKADSIADFVGCRVKSRL